MSLGAIMMRTLSILTLFFSLCGFASTSETLFPSGQYLGEGKYTISNGTQGTYASFADLEGEEWQLSYLRHGQPLLYSVDLEFKDFGFFDAFISENNSDGEQMVHPGEGYCGSRQCHLSFDLDDRYIEETITLYPEENRIIRLGSLSYFDDNDNQQIVFWQENMVRISGNSAANR